MDGVVQRHFKWSTDNLKYHLLQKDGGDISMKKQKGCHRPRLLLVCSDSDVLAYHASSMENLSKTRRQ